MIDPDVYMFRVNRIIKAARNPRCNFSEERECGSVNGVYYHHKIWCPAGILEQALADYDEMMKL